MAQFSYFGVRLDLKKNSINPFFQKNNFNASLFFLLNECLNYSLLHQITVGH